MSMSPISSEFNRYADNAPFGELALTLLLFTHRLHTLLIDARVPEVAFLAREGLVLKDLFDIYQSALVPPDRTIRSRYLLVSRRALYTASLPADETSFEFLRSHYREISVPDFLDSLGMADELARHQCSSTLPDSVEDLVGSSRFQSQFRVHRNGQRSILTRYLDPALESGGGHLHVVDVGWKGSMQQFLGSIIEDTSKVSGSYFGLSVPRADRDMRGLVFEIGPPRTQYFNVFAHFKSLYETLLNAKHGSVVRYSMTGDEVTPELDTNNLETD